MHLLFSMTGIHQERNDGLEATHLAVYLFKDDGSSRADTRVMRCCCFHFVPVIIPGNNAVEDGEEEGGSPLKLFY